LNESHIFGAWLDVHSGGIDLLYPHHENEEAQCCAYHGKDQWVGHWIHSGHLRISGGVKMSKSLKNSISVETFLEKHSVDQFRMLCLMSNYRKEMEYSEESLKIAKDVLTIFNTFLMNCDSFVKNSFKSSHSINGTMLHQKLEETKIAVKNHFADDFNTAQATTKVRNLMSLTEKEMKLKSDVENSKISGIDAIAAVSNFVSHYLKSLGFNQMNSKVSSNKDHEVDSILDELNEFRRHVRSQALAMDKNENKRSLLAACDNLRKNLEFQGIQIKDQLTTSSWNWKK